MGDTPKMESGAAGRAKLPDPAVHLFRGSPAVRSWSKYQETDRRWYLCGRPPKRDAGRNMKDFLDSTSRN